MNYLDILSIAGFVVGILGLVLSVYFYFKSVERKDPTCYYATFRDIEKLSTSYDKKVRVFFENQEVNRVFTSYLWFWNRGKKPITSEDLPNEESIVFTLTDEKYDVQILDYEIMKVSRESVHISLSKESPTSLRVNFNFLDHNDGAVIVIQHTGSGNTVIHSNGTILGAPKGVQTSAFRKEKPLDREEFLFTRMAYTFPLGSRAKFILFLIMGVLSSALFLGLLYGMDYLDSYLTKASDYLAVPEFDLDSVWLKVILVLLGWIVSAYFVFQERVPYPSSLIIDETVEIYEDLVEEGVVDEDKVDEVS